MRKFTSWNEAKKAYGWVGSEPIAQQARLLFETEQAVCIVTPSLYEEERAVIEAAKAWAQTQDGRRSATGEGAAEDDLYRSVEALQKARE